MSREELEYRLLSDLQALNLPVNEVELQIRPFSKTYYGRYLPVYEESNVLPIVRIYPFADEKNEKLLDYEEILKTTIHELCHHIQYMDKSFVRLKGCMHNEQFWRLYNHYCNRATRLELIGGEKSEKKQQSKAV